MTGTIHSIHVIRMYTQIPFKAPFCILFVGSVCLYGGEYRLEANGLCVGLTLLRLTAECH